MAPPGSPRIPCMSKPVLTCSSRQTLSLPRPSPPCSASSTSQPLQPSLITP
ncbi:hypothetical protein B0H17DRAFT_1101051 [Mycena rosella]|uniref:Uncharacterized protein n=1 Tax=Mycena rosella TaxID=1033263 RepID=A0AAD7CM70_MYCRO|nr:hypothetical protein B0H17DRAFT_1101051 [Mycena rosella]